MKYLRLLSQVRACFQWLLSGKSHWVSFLTEPSLNPFKISWSCNLCTSSDKFDKRRWHICILDLRIEGSSCGLRIGSWSWFKFSYFIKYYHVYLIAHIFTNDRLFGHKLLSLILALFVIDFRFESGSFKISLLLF